MVDLKKDEKVVTPGPSDNIGSVSDGDLKGVAKSLPEVVPDAVAAAKEKERQRQEIWSKAVDRDKKKFDPLLHEFDKETGIPVKGRNGLFKKRDRTHEPHKHRSKFERVLKKPIHFESEGADSVKREDLGQAVIIDPLLVEAAQYTDFFIANFSMVAGDEAAPDPGEREALITGWYKFFQKYGSLPLDPIFMLVMFHTSYIGKRASKPKTKGFLNWVRMKVGNFFAYTMRGKRAPEYKKENDNGK